MIEIVTWCVSLFILSFIVFITFNNFFLFCFLYVEYNIGFLQNPRQYPPVSLWHYIKNFWLELWYVLGKFYLWPLKFVSLNVNAHKKSKIAILLIHGYYRNQTDWWWLRSKIAKHKYPVFTVNLVPPLASIADITSINIPAKIAQIKLKTGCEDIVLIGHSMGGLVASQYAMHMDHEKLICAVITIGTPFYGTKVSIMAAGENAKDMRPGSKFLANLRERVTKNPHKFFQIMTRMDNIVFPWHSAALDDIPDTQKLVLPHAGHLEMLHSKEVARQINQIIANL
jgi:pimeloyl-ACP methyl ester carboxylesterase